MTKREFLEQKRLTDPVWYAQHVGFNANGELVDPSQQPVIANPIAQGEYPEKIIDWAERYFKVGVLTCLAVIAIAAVVLTSKYK